MPDEKSALNEAKGESVGRMPDWFLNLIPKEGIKCKDEATPEEWEAGQKALESLRNEAERRKQLKEHAEIPLEIGLYNATRALREMGAISPQIAGQDRVEGNYFNELSLLAKPSAIDLQEVRIAAFPLGKTDIESKQLALHMANEKDQIVLHEPGNKPRRFRYVNPEELTKKSWGEMKKQYMKQAAASMEHAMLMEDIQAGLIVEKLFAFGNEKQFKDRSPANYWFELDSIGGIDFMSPTLNNRIAEAFANHADLKPGEKPEDLLKRLDLDPIVEDNAVGYKNIGVQLRENLLNFLQTHNLMPQVDSVQVK